MSTSREKKLLLVLLALYFFTVAVNANDDKVQLQTDTIVDIFGERQPEIDTIDFREAVRIAKDLLPGRKSAEYENLEFKIIVARKNTTWGYPVQSEEYALEVLESMLDDVYARARYDYLEYFRETHRKLGDRIYWFIYFVPVGHEVGDGGVGFLLMRQHRNWLKFTEMNSMVAFNAAVAWGMEVYIWFWILMLVAFQYEYIKRFPGKRGRGTVTKIQKKRCHQRRSQTARAGVIRNLQVRQ